VTRERWQEVKKVLADALEPKPEERSAATASYLDLEKNIQPAVRPHQDAFALIDRLYTTRVSSIGP